MKLTLLGTGSPSPNPKRRGPSQVIECGQLPLCRGDLAGDLRAAVAQIAVAGQPGDEQFPVERFELAKDLGDGRAVVLRPVKLTIPGHEVAAGERSQQARVERAQVIDAEGEDRTISIGADITEQLAQCLLAPVRAALTGHPGRPAAPVAMPLDDDARASAVSQDQPPAVKLTGRRGNPLRRVRCRKSEEDGADEGVQRALAGLVRAVDDRDASRQRPEGPSSEVAEAVNLDPLDPHYVIPGYEASQRPGRGESCLPVQGVRTPIHRMIPPALRTKGAPHSVCSRPRIV